MALNWDCSAEKSCDDVGRARYTMPDRHHITAAAAAALSAAQDDDEEMSVAARTRGPNKVRFAFQQRRSGGDRANNKSSSENKSAQDICSYPASAFGPPFAPPRYRHASPALREKCDFHFIPAIWGRGGVTTCSSYELFLWCCVDLLQEPVWKGWRQLETYAWTARCSRPVRHVYWG